MPNGSTKERGKARTPLLLLGRGTRGGQLACGSLLLTTVLDGLHAAAASVGLVTAHNNTDT